MQRLGWLVLSCAVLLSSGCIGENRKPTEEPPSKKQKVLDEQKQDTSWLTYREIGPAKTPEVTTRLRIRKDGYAQVDRVSLVVQENLLAPERQDLDALARGVSWSGLPFEYKIPNDRPGAATAMTYEVTWGEVEPARTVTTHDLVDGEDEALKKLRNRLQEILKRLLESGERR